MKLFQPIFFIATLLVAVLAQEEGQQQPNCDAICNERVQQAVQPINDEKVRAEEWGHGVRRDLDEANNRIRGLEEEIGQWRGSLEERDRWVGERDQSINELRGSLENSQRDVENTRREVDQIKLDSTAELDQLRAKVEESTRALGRVQFALDEANDQIKEMEGARISVNFKGIQEDVRLYWKNLLGWWTGLVMPDKKKKDGDL